MRARNVAAPDASTIEQAAQGFPYPGRPGLEWISTGLAGRETAEVALAAAREHQAILVEGDDALCFAGITCNEWECETLGLRVGRLTTVVSLGPSLRRHAAVKQLLSEISRLDFDVLFLAADTRDLVTAHAAQEFGFEVFSTSMTYLYLPGRVERSGSKSNVHIRPATDPPMISPSDLEALLERASKPFGSHLWNDTRLPRDRVGEVYRSWARNVATGSWADWIVTMHREDRIVGLLGLAERSVGPAPDDMRTALDPTFGLSSDPQGGVLRAMFEGQISHSYTGRLPCEFNTQASNFPTMQVVARLPNTQVVGSKLMMHLWLT